ncbi:hypothetical protein CRG98_027455 [Punica granatum]|uniref:Uncharacterized protein n=1 Tax=Punica granatum TaxID=22663 RepID=A0A2I0J7E5_PUNGR|nr:hypothetical protein CRG98_027455 [Punica granatum]
MTLSKVHRRIDIAIGMLRPGQGAGIRDLEGADNFSVEVQKCQFPGEKLIPNVRYGHALQDCTGRLNNSGNKRPPQSPRGVPWLPKAADLAQNSIGSLRDDVRPDLCQSGLSTLPVGSVATIQVCSSQNSPNPTHQRSNPTLEGPIPPLETRYDHPRLRGARTFILLLCLWSFKGF